MKTVNKKLLLLSLAAFGLSTAGAFASTGNEPVNIEAELIRAIATQTQAQIAKPIEAPKHRNLLFKEIREGKVGH